MKFIKHLRASTAIFVVILLIAGLFGFEFYQRSDMKARSVLNQKLQEFVQQRDENDIRSVSADDETYQFFMKLPRNAQVLPDKTSDNQGSVASKGRYVFLFVSDVAGQKINVYMTQTYHCLNVQWEVLKVSIDELPSIWNT